MPRLIPLSLVAALATCTPIPAKAETILPHLFAYRFCELRRFGVDFDSAIRAAYQSASISGNDWTYLTARGQQHRSDHYLAGIQITKTCPELSR